MQLPGNPVPLLQDRQFLILLFQAEPFLPLLGLGKEKSRHHRGNSYAHTISQSPACGDPPEKKAEKNNWRHKRPRTPPQN